MYAVLHDDGIVAAAGGGEHELLRMELDAAYGATPVAAQLGVHTAGLKVPDLSGTRARENRREISSVRSWPGHGI